MAELRLEDIGAILLGLVIVGVAYAGVRLLYEYRAGIALFVGALWRRYIAVGDWRAAMDRLADERASVRRYEEWEEDELSIVPYPAHMSTSEQRPDRRVAAHPGTGFAPGPNSVPTAAPPNLTEDRLFQDSVLLKNRQGKWYFSTKKLYALWGGNHDELLAKIRALRGDGPAEDAPDDVMLTPIAQRPTRASYYADAPELEYQAPEV